MRLLLHLTLLLIASTGSAQDMMVGIEAYENGEYETAISELTLHAMNGDPLAADIVGSLYYKGEGTVQDYESAAFWFLQSIRYGPDEGHTILGMMYYLGQGVQQDFNRAAQYLELPAKMGDETAIFILNTLRENCTEVRVNHFDCDTTRQTLNKGEQDTSRTRN